MKKRLLSFWIVLAIVCIVSVTNESVRAQSFLVKDAQHEVNVESYNKRDMGCNETKQRAAENTFIESNHTNKSYLPKNRK
jgi:hypothetical protein